MEMFNILAGVSSIASLILTVFVATKVVNINNKIKSNITHQVNLGKEGRQAGRDINA